MTWRMPSWTRLRLLGVQVSHCTRLTRGQCFDLCPQLATCNECYPIVAPRYFVQRLHEPLDICLPCPLATYRTAASAPHKSPQCTPCQAGYYTSLVGATLRADCNPPNVETYTSTHRVWYYFGPIIKANTDCMQVDISARDVSATMGVSAVRQPSVSPMCSPSSAAFAKDYIDSKLWQSYTWNNFPLNISVGEFLAITALPGQITDAHFTGYRDNTAQNTILEAAITLCGCVDYTTVLPSYCTGAVMATMGSDRSALVARIAASDHPDAYFTLAGNESLVTATGLELSAKSRGVFPKVVSASDLDGSCRDSQNTYPNRYEASGQTDGDCLHQCTLEASCIAYEFTRTTPSECPTCTGTCRVYGPSITVHHAPDGWSFVVGTGGVVVTRADHGALRTVCKAKTLPGTATNAVAEAGLQISAAPFDTFNCTIDPAAPPGGLDLVEETTAASSDTDCAVKCSRRGPVPTAPNCVAYHFVPSTRGCTRLYPATWIAPSDVVLTPALFPLAAGTLVCARNSRGDGTSGRKLSDQEMRYHVTNQVAIKLPASVKVGVTKTKALLRTCTRNQLACAGSCTPDDLLAALDGDIVVSSAGSLLQTDEPLRFGCQRRSGTSVKEDCVPPDEVQLRDLSAGYHFMTDVTGRPGQFTLLQTRGKLHMDWLDHSLCEQAFSFIRRKGKSVPFAAGGRIGVPTVSAGDWGEAESFAQDYYVQGPGSCNEHIIPATTNDDLTGLASATPPRPLGLQQEYCIEATSNSGAATRIERSAPTCSRHRVFWEATRVGVVTAKGTGLPVAGVTVSWRVTGSSLAGQVVTEGDGRFEIHIRDVTHELWDQVYGQARLSYEAVDIVAEVKKGNDPFACEGVLHKLCGGKDTVSNYNFPPRAFAEDNAVEGGGAVFLWTATYMKFTHDALEVLQVVHAPIAPVDGEVYFALQHHLFAPGDGRSTRYDLAADASFLPQVPVPSTSSLTEPTGLQVANKCYVKVGETAGGSVNPGSSETICMYDYDANEGLVQCTGTDATGKYHLPAAMNSRVFLIVRKGGHRFLMDTQHIAPAHRKTLPLTTGAENRANFYEEKPPVFVLVICVQLACGKISTSGSKNKHYCILGLRSVL